MRNATCSALSDTGCDALSATGLAISAGGLSTSLGLFNGLETLPRVCRPFVFRRPICEAEKVRATILAIARTALLGDFDEAQGLQCAKSGGDRVTMNAVSFEVIERSRQGAVVSTSVIGKLDFKPG